VDKIEGKVDHIHCHESGQQACDCAGGRGNHPKIRQTLLRERNSLNVDGLRIVDAVKTGDIIARFETVSKKTIRHRGRVWPRVRTFLEIAEPKKEAMIVENDGVVRLIGNNVIIESFEWFQKAVQRPAAGVFQPPGCGR